MRLAGASGTLSPATVRIYGLLAGECFRAMDEYQPSLPTARWEPIREFVSDAAAICAPQCAFSVIRLMTVLSGYVDWAHNTCGIPLQPKLILRRATIDHFYGRDDLGLAEGTRRNYRSIVRRIGEILVPDAHPKSVRPLNARASYPPYTEKELRRIRIWADAQPTPYSRGKAAVLLAFGAGAGLKAREIASVRFQDLLIDAEGILIRVGGDAPREVPLLMEWEAPLKDALDQCRDAAPDALVYAMGRDLGYSPNIIARFVSSSERVPGTPPIQTNRLRNTWLVTHLAARTDLRSLQRAAGLVRFENLAGLLEHVPHLDAHAYRYVMRCEDGR